MPNPRPARWWAYTHPYSDPPGWIAYRPVPAAEAARHVAEGTARVALATDAGAKRLAGRRPRERKDRP